MWRNLKLFINNKFKKSETNGTEDLNEMQFKSINVSITNYIYMPRECWILLRPLHATQFSMSVFKTI
jgi:hypothetical protein